MFCGPSKGRGISAGALRNHDDALEKNARREGGRETPAPSWVRWRGKRCYWMMNTFMLQGASVTVIGKVCVPIGLVAGPTQSTVV